MKNRVLWTSALMASTLVTLATGCKSNLPAPGEAPIVDASASATDPADANMAAYAGGAAATRVAANSYAAPQQVSTESYPQQQGAPANYGVGNSQRNEAYQYNTQQPANAYGDNPQANAAEYDQYSALLDPNVPAAEQAPPPLPADYEQPEAPGPDYMWTPGYWDYSTAGYYYVPGVWVGAPYANALWTPGWWGFFGNRYRWHHGYWGTHVGYYGGINYGFGYIGFGYQGGYWNNNHFWYNRSVLRVNPRYVNNNVYQRNITVNNREYVNNTRVSYFGGNGGLRRGPAPQEAAALREPRTAPMQAQMENRRAAEGNRGQFFGANNGRPAMMVAAHPIAADHNVQAPNRTMPVQNGFTGARPGNENRPVVENRAGGSINTPQQSNAQQHEQNLQQRDQNLQRRDQNLQQRGANLQQRDSNLQQRNDNIQQRGQLEQQRQQTDVQNQQRMQQEQQRQQANVQNGQRVQQDGQRVQQEQQRNQFQQQQNAQRQQQDQQRVQQQQQVNTQREQQVQQQRAQPQHVMERPSAASQPAPHVEAARPAPAPAPAQHAGPPPSAPHPMGGGGGGEHHH